MNLTISSEKDKVVLTFPRRRDLQLKPDEARSAARHVRASALECQQWHESGGTPGLLTGGTRGALVQSWDGFVNVRLDSITDREEIPYRAALALADEIEAKADEAEHRVTIVFPNLRLAEKI